MEIIELIESIAETGGYMSSFMVVMNDTQHPLHIEGNDYHALSKMTRLFLGQEEIVAFLFDCDMRGWKLVKFDRTCGIGGACCVNWHITIER